MKTCHQLSMAGVMLAAGTMTLLSAPVRAEDDGVVRLGSGSQPSATSTDEGVVVVRGQSNYRQRNAQTSKALLQLMSAQDQAAAAPGGYCDSYNSCDGCDSYPVTPECAAPACAAPVCGPNACAAPVCGAPFNNACDGCAPYINANACDGCCSYCGGDGCSHCNGNGYANGYGSGYGRGGVFNRMTDYPHGYAGTGCGVCDTEACINRNCVASFLGDQASMHRARKRVANQNLNAYLRCKLGYFLPDGCGGAGCKPFGHYSIVYADNPAHFDQRDGQVYAAQGVGGPVSVPLAPNVRHAYNYGWGIPSSRLTPISNTGY